MVFIKNVWNNKNLLLISEELKQVGFNTSVK